MQQRHHVKGKRFATLDLKYERKGCEATVQNLNDMKHPQSFPC